MLKMPLNSPRPSSMVEVPKVNPPPRDVILTGTPSGVGPMLPGQVVSVDIEGIGTLTNPVVSAAPDEAPNEAEQ